MDILLNPTDQSVIKQQTAINNRYLTATTSGFLCYFLLFLVAHTDPNSIILLFFLWLEIFTLLALAISCTTQVFYGLADSKAIIPGEDKYLAHYVVDQKRQRAVFLYIGCLELIYSAPVKPFNQVDLIFPVGIIRLGLFIIIATFFIGEVLLKQQTSKNELYNLRFPRVRQFIVRGVITFLTTFAIAVSISIGSVAITTNVISSILNDTLLITLVFVVALITAWQLWQLKPKQQTVKQ